MKKFSTIYWAFSTVASVGLVIYSFITVNDLEFYICSLLIVALLAPCFFIKSRDVKKNKQIERVYTELCDPVEYLELQEIEFKKTFKTKMSTYLYQVRRADFLAEAGKFQESREILEQLIDYENEFNCVVLALYYKVWISYFLEYGNLSRVEVLLEQLQSTAMAATKRNIQMLCTSIYYSCQAKYNAITNRDIDNTESFFAGLVNLNRGKVYTVAGMYYLALIALNRNELDKAQKRCEYVANNGNNTFYAEKAKNILKRFEKTPLGEN